MRWEVANSKLCLSLHFKSVQELAAFVSELAPLVDRENHHPNMVINHTNLEISLFTYDLNAISERDYAMADLISELIGNRDGIA